jgi:hypothetical protein
VTAAAARLGRGDRLAEVDAYLRAAGYIWEAETLAAALDRQGALTFQSPGQPSGQPSGRACRARRDQAYRALAMLLGSPSLSASGQAAAVVRAVSRYEASAWKRDRRAGREAIPHGDLQRRLKFDILNSGSRPLGHTALRQLIGKSS